MHNSSAKTLLLRPNSYVDAEDWDDLVHVSTESLKHSSLDGMTLLLHTSISGPLEQQSEFIRQVSYSTLDEVPKLLLSMTLSALGAGLAPAHQQRPHVEAETGVQADIGRDGQGQDEGIDIPGERIAYGGRAGVVVSGRYHGEEIDWARFHAAVVIQDAYRCHLERKWSGAVRKIQAAYRRHLKRKSVVYEGIDATQAHYWDLLRKRSTEVEWTKDSRYYLLFRVPLADILVCLDAIKTFVESEKKEAKKRVMTEDDKHLEELMKVLDQHRYDNVGCTF